MSLCNQEDILAKLTEALRIEIMIEVMVIVEAIIEGEIIRKREKEIIDIENIYFM